MQELKSPWTTKDTETLRILLDKLPSPMPYDAYHALCKCLVQPAYELVILRRKHDHLERYERDTIEVFLTQRPANDPDWPSQWHYPGTMLRPKDKTLDCALGRLKQTELVSELLIRPDFVGVVLTHFSRGPIAQLIHMVRVCYDPKQTSFFDVERLPASFIEHQRPGLERAVRAFKNLRFD